MVAQEGYENYIKTKLAWAPEIPVGWHVRKLTHAISYTVGFTPESGNPLYYGDDFLWANISDLGPRVLNETSKGITYEAVAKYRKRPTNAGTLLYSFKLSVGQVSFAGTEMFTNEAIASFSESDWVHLPYFYYLAPLAIIQNASENIYGAKILNQEAIGNAKLIIPPIYEQQAIARFLDFKTAQIDALIAKKQTLLDKLAEKRTALISHAVTKGLDPSVPMKDSGVAWLGAIPYRWVTKRLRFCMAMNPSKSEIELDDLELVSFIPMEAVGEFGGIKLETEKELGEISGGYTYFANEDVVVAKITPCFENGKGAIARDLKNGIAFGTTELHVMRSGETLLSDYLFHLTMSHPFRCMGESEMYGAGGQKRVPEKFLKDFRIGLPPLNEQHDIVEHINKINHKLDQQMLKTTDAISRLVEYRSALITNAVTGKIDVRDFKLPSLKEDTQHA